MLNLVTTVITTYKRPLTILKRAIDSVINQSYPQIEIIVVNDNPEDKSNSQAIKDLVLSYKTREVLYLEPRCNSGACVARNLGIAKAKGTYIGFLDDDDYWLEDKIEIQVRGFKQENVGVVYTPFYRSYHKKRELMPTLGKSGKVTEFLLYSYILGIFPLSRMSLVKEIGGFDPELPSSQDYDFFLRLSTKTEFLYIDTPTAVYEVSEISISTNVKKKIRGFELFMKKHSDLYQRYPKALHYQLIRMVNNMITSGQYRYAWSLMMKSLRIRLFSTKNLMEPAKGMIKRMTGRKSFH